MRTINLPTYGICISLDDKSAGNIIYNQNLYEICPKCGQRDCIWSCPGACLGEVETNDDVRGRIAFNGAVDGIMSMILAHAVADIDIESPKYLEGIKTAVEAAGNQ